MSKLILPGSAEFEETTNVIDLRTKRPRSRLVGVEPTPVIVEDPVPSGDLSGRTLMLNLAACRGFQCGGFQLSLHRTFAVVDEKAQQAPIKAALADGRLVDITGQNPKTGFKNKDGSVSKVTQEDTGLKVFMGRNAAGEMVVMAPKTKKQAQAYERQIKKTGAITAPEFTRAKTGLSSISVEDVPLDAHGGLILTDLPPTRGKPSVRTPGRQRKSRRG